MYSVDLRRKIFSAVWMVWCKSDSILDQLTEWRRNLLSN